MKRILCCLLVVLLAGSFSSGQEPEADIPLTFGNYRAWQKHIMPAEAELEFFKIPWERTFQDGILKANRERKPVLLWTMNGHPLGCT